MAINIAISVLLAICVVLFNVYAAVRSTIFLCYFIYTVFVDFLFTIFSPVLSPIF